MVPRKEKIIVGVVVCAVLAAVVGVGLKLGWHHGEAKQSCYANLIQIDGAKAAWAIDHNKAKKDVPTWSDLVAQDRSLRRKPVCPAGGIYTIGSVGERATCTYHRTYR